jgi:hypothetical protein
MAIDIGPPSYAAVKFNNVGDSVKGTIISAEGRPFVRFGEHQQATRRDGTPIFEWVISLQTEERDSAIEDDDGKRTLYVNKWRQKRAIIKAIREAGLSGSIDEGARLLVRREADGPAEAGYTPQMWTAQYKAPEPEMEAPGLRADDLL